MFCVTVEDIPQSFIQFIDQLSLFPTSHAKYNSILRIVLLYQLLEFLTFCGDKNSTRHFHFGDAMVLVNGKDWATDRSTIDNVSVPFVGAR